MFDPISVHLYRHTVALAFGTHTVKCARNIKIPYVFDNNGGSIFIMSNLDRRRGLSVSDESGEYG